MSPGDGRIFGIPLGDFGIFSSLLLSLALGFISFFASAFVAIFAILIYNSAGHHAVDFADSYKFVALPVGLLVLFLSLVLFGTLWIRRKTSGR
jgi:hypothetical protein